MLQLYNSYDYVAITGAFWFVFFYLLDHRRERYKKTIYQQTRIGKALIIFRVVICYALIYLPALSIGWLGQLIIPQNPNIGIMGSFICAFGLLFAVWARRTLGRNWSGIITLKENHKLIQDGPYKLVRHPIYTGLMLAWLGSAVTLGEIRGAIAILLTYFGIWDKLKEEEFLLMKQFPAEYPIYKQRVKAIIPFIF